MAISVLDVRDTFAAPLRLPSRAVRTAADSLGTARRRLPVTVVAAAAVAGIESVALLAAGLTGLDGVLASPLRPAGTVVALGLGLLATWIVLCAGGGAALLEASGNRLFRGIASAELALIGVLLVLTQTTTLFDALSFPLPLPGIALLALAVPTGKLLLAGAPTAAQWVAQGPRMQEQRPDPVARHRLLCGATLAVIGLALGVVTVLTPAAPAAHTAVAGVVSSH